MHAPPLGDRGRTDETGLQATMFKTRHIVRAMSAAAVAAALASASPHAAGAASSPGRFGGFDVRMPSATGNFRTGDFTIPGTITGTSPDGDLRADHGVLKNFHQLTLIGHVVVHQRPRNKPPITLTSDELVIDNKTKLYVARGNAVATQGARTLSASLMTLDDDRHYLTLTGGVLVRENDRTMTTAELRYDAAGGAFVAPTTVTGHGSDGDVRADRATGNLNAGQTTLEGSVVVHKLGGVGRTGSKDPVTLTADRLDVDSASKQYVANGHAVIVQGGRTLSAPMMTLDDMTHLAHLTGGVRADEKPNRTFEAGDVTYNTQTEDFKATGGVRMLFPAPTKGPKPTPTPKRSG